MAWLIGKKFLSRCRNHKLYVAVTSYDLKSPDEKQDTLHSKGSYQNARTSFSEAICTDRKVCLTRRHVVTLIIADTAMIITVTDDENHR